MNARVNINVHIPVSNMDELRKALNVLGTYDLLVGVPADGMRDKADAANQGKGTTARTMKTVKRGRIVRSGRK